MISSLRIGAVALMVCALATGACGKKQPPATPQPPAPPVPTQPTTPPTPPPPAPPPPATPPRAANRHRGDARVADEERRPQAGLLRLRLNDAHRGSPGHPAEERRVPEGPANGEGGRRRPRRFTRYQRIQPGADRSPRVSRARLPRQPRHHRGSCRCRSEGRGTAVLQGRNGSVLGAESRRLLRLHREVGVSDYCPGCRARAISSAALRAFAAAMIGRPTTR